MATRAPRRRRVREDRFDWRAEARDMRREQRQEAALLARPMRQYAELIPEPGFGPLDFGLFPYQVEWYSQEVADAEEVVWVKSTQVGMCLSPHTRVLSPDLRWVPIGGIEVGDELVAVDENHGGAARGRRLRVAVVEAKWETRRPAYRVAMSNGVEFVASGEHRWLCQQRGGRSTQWRQTDAMRVGDRIRAVTRPWEAASYEDGWMGGLLDGEGSLRTNQQRAGSDVVIVQRHGPVYDRARAYLAERGYTFAEKGSAGGFTGLVTPRLSLSRTDEILRLVGQTRPSRMVGSCWWAGMAPPGMGEAAWPVVVAIEPVGQRRLVDLQTSHATFIAEGLISHNSAYAWRWSVRRSDQFADTGVYIFPADTHVTEFGDERIEPAIEQSPYLRARIPRSYVRHKRLKRIGGGFLHLRGSNSKAGAQSVAAQYLVFDEYDFLDATNLPQIERRITGARQLGKRPRIRRLGTPTIDGFGISAAWESSDKRVWIVTCHECDHEQEVTFEGSLRWRSEPGGKVMRAGRDVFDDPAEVAEVWRECERCGESLEGDIAVGRWVAQRPGRRVIGFHATRLIVPTTDLAQIVRASRRTKPAEVEAFENNDLGRAYSAAEASLDVPALLAACELGGARQDFYAGARPVTMGVDVAGERDLTVRIDEQLPAEGPGIPNPRRALWVGEVKGFDDVIRLIDRFRPMQVAIDANPERRMARALQARYAPGRVVLVEYDARNESDAIKLTEVGQRGTPLDGVPLKVRVNRTEAIDAMMDSIRQLRNLPLHDPPPKWIDQMRALKRRTELDTRGRPRRVYVTTGTVGDDYAHADVYALVATELWRLRGGANALAGPPARTLEDQQLGFERVRLTGDNPSIYSPGFGEGDLLR